MRRHSKLVFPHLNLLLGLLLGGSALAQEPRVPREETLHWVPAEGAAHPIFAGVGPSDTLEVYLSFGQPTQPGPNLAARLGSQIIQWKRKTMRSLEKRPTIEVKAHRRSLQTVISDSAEPMAIVEDLVETFRRSGLPLSEVFLIRRKTEGDGGRGAPTVDPRMPEVTEYSDAETFWPAVFDSSQVPPATEDTANLLNMVTFEDGNVVYEVRGMPLFFPDVRIVYGTPRVDMVEADGRSLEVAEALKRSFEKSFPHKAEPTFIDTEGNANRVVKVKRGQRAGYSFAIRRGDEKMSPFVVRLPEGFRYREYELLAGIRDVVHEMDLEPVILWSRGSVYIVNLWERLPAD